MSEDQSERTGPAHEDGTGPAIRRLDAWDPGQLCELAERYETPLYVLDLDRVRENYRRLLSAFERPSQSLGENSFTGPADVYYAAKANTARPVLTTLAESGAGIECASAGETVRALDAGVPAERVQYTAVNPPARDLDTVIERWQGGATELTITAGAVDTIDRLAERGYDGRLCIRVNTGVGAGHHEKVSTGADATFGIPADRVPEVLREADERGFEVVGIHAHAGSGISGDDLATHREFVSRVGSIARESPIDLAFVDVGGGIGVPYRRDEPPVDLEAIATTTREAHGQFDGRLRIEPGRYVVADAGVLLCRVNTIKESEETSVTGVDAGMTDLLRPAMYDAFHELRNCTAEQRAEAEICRQTVAGPICESADVFATDRALRAPRRGDVLAIGNAGAYGYEMASTYNARPRPATVVLVEGEDQLARRRETLADVTRLETPPGGTGAHHR
jgi:diaminopimelate decarboxylase